MTAFAAMPSLGTNGRQQTDTCRKAYACCSAIAAGGIGSVE